MNLGLSSKKFRYPQLLTLMCAALGCVSCGPLGIHGCENPKEHAARLSAQHGIRIEFGAPSTFFTQPYGPADAVRPWLQAQPAEPTAAGIALEGIGEALQVYPDGFVDNLIDAIFICGKLYMGGVQAGGTAGPAWIILSAPSDENRASIVLTAELGVHHELSSFVLRQDPTTMERWKALSASASGSVSDPGQALRDGDGDDPDPSTGYLTAYGATNPENDFNTYSEKIFADPEALKKLAREHPLIRSKLDFLLRTYLASDPRLKQRFLTSGLLDGVK